MNVVRIKSIFLRLASSAHVILSIFVFPAKRKDLARDVTRIDGAEGQAIGKLKMRARSASRQTQNLINIHEMTLLLHFDSLKPITKMVRNNRCTAECVLDSLSRSGGILEAKFCC